MKKKLLSVIVICLLVFTVCGCQNQENAENGSVSAGTTGTEAETETEMGNVIRTLKIDDKSKKYVDYFLDGDLYSLCEYNAPEEVSRMDLFYVFCDGDQILEEERIESITFEQQENLRSAVIAVYQAEEGKYNIKLTSANGKSKQGTKGISFVPFTEGYIAAYQDNSFPEKKITAEKQYPLFSVTGSPENAPSDGSETEKSEIYAVFY